MTSLLFPSELLGAGTFDVESFPSYLFRLANNHCVSVGEVIKYCFNKSTIPKSSPPSSYMSTTELARPENRTILLSHMLEELTSTDLRSSLPHFLRSPLGRSYGEIAQGIRWCPECFRYMSEKGETPYIKLVWHLSAIRACPIHRTPFMNKCSCCDCPQTSYKRTGPMDQCQQCGAWLANRADEVTNRDISYSWQDIGFDIIELMEVITKPDAKLYTQDGIQRFMKGLFDVYWHENREENLYELLGRDWLLSLVHGQRNISLKTSRNLAFQFGVSLHSLFSGNYQSFGSLNHEQFCALPPAYLKARPKQQRNHRQTQKRITAIANSADPPLSLNQLCKAAKVSVGYVQYRFPSLASRLVSTHQTYIKEKHKIEQNDALKEAYAHFRSDEVPSELKSTRKAYKVLREKTGLPKAKLLNAIDEVRRNMAKV